MFPAFPFSRTMAAISAEWKNGNSAPERQNGTAKRLVGYSIMATEWWKLALMWVRDHVPSLCSLLAVW